ncbi:MAG TPA: hypothetical protein VMR00_00705 [Streptosporangiaceae bacterium]|nr:hypothetical protein [Streptosporangiaceae bacterium]
MTVVIDELAPTIAPESDFPDLRTMRPLPDLRNGLNLNQCREGSELFLGLVRKEAESCGVDERALRVRALLHLPRIVAYTGSITMSRVERELWHCARQLRKDASQAEAIVPKGVYALNDLKFTEDFDPLVAGKLISSMHYLGSARAGSRYFALVDPVHGRPVTVGGAAPLEWKRVSNWAKDQFKVSPEKIWDVARVFSCPSAPPNAVSFLLARMRNSLAQGAVDLLLTAVDPNLGFTGASYRAANWRRCLTIAPRPYLYLDCRYISPRQLKERFGTSSLTELRVRHPDRRFEQSRVRLLDSLIFCCPVRSKVPPDSAGFDRRLHR